MTGGERDATGIEMRMIVPYVQKAARGCSIVSILAGRIRYCITRRSDTTKSAVGHVLLCI